MLDRIISEVNIGKILKSLALEDPEPIIEVASVKFVVLLQPIQSCPVEPGSKTAAISLAGILELRETKELRATSEALENRSSDHSVVGEVGIVRVRACVVAITFVTLKEKMEIETKAVGFRDVNGSPIAELVGFEIDVVLVGTKMDIVLVRIEIDMMLVETKEDVMLVGIKMDIVLTGTEADMVLVDIVLVGTEMDMVRVGTKMDMVLVGTEIDTVWLNVKVLLAIVRLSPFAGRVDGKESSCVDSERVVGMLKYLFELGIKLADWEAPLKESGEVYIGLDIWLESDMSGSAVERNSLLEGCVVVVTVPKEVIDLKVKSVIVLVKEI